MTPRSHPQVLVGHALAGSVARVPERRPGRVPRAQRAHALPGVLRSADWSPDDVSVERAGAAGAGRSVSEGRAGDQRRRAARAHRDGQPPRRPNGRRWRSRSSRSSIGSRTRRSTACARSRIGVTRFPRSSAGPCRSASSRGTGRLRASRDGRSRTSRPCASIRPARTTRAAASRRSSAAGSIIATDS